jgi:NADH-quinone oxidoreductase subunit K
MNFVIVFSLPFLLFFIGLIGVFTNKKNIILIIVCVELMLLAVNFNFLIFSYFVDDALGQIFAVFVLTVAAAESSIGLAILVCYYRINGTVAIEFVNYLKG